MSSACKVAAGVSHYSVLRYSYAVSKPNYSWIALHLRQLGKNRLHDVRYANRRWHFNDVAASLKRPLIHETLHGLGSRRQTTFYCSRGGSELERRKQVESTAGGGVKSPRISNGLPLLHWQTYQSDSVYSPHTSYTSVREHTDWNRPGTTTIQPNYSQNSAVYGHDTVINIAMVQPEHSQNTTRLQPEYKQNIARIHQDYSQNTPRI